MMAMICGRGRVGQLLFGDVEYFLVGQCQRGRSAGDLGQAMVKKANTLNIEACGRPVGRFLLRSADARLRWPVR